MKKIKKLGLQKETVRQLQSKQLEVAAGGITGKNCSVGLTGCGLCPPPRPTLAYTDCFCLSDVCTFE